MKRNAKKNLFIGITLILSFVIWTILVMTFDVRPIGLNGSDVGFATVNSAVHKLTGTDMLLYNITDRAGLVPIFVCFVFAVLFLVLTRAVYAVILVFMMLIIKGTLLFR